MRRILLTTAMLALSAAPASASSRMGECLLQVKQKAFLKGRCEITINDSRGSFAIGVGQSHRSKYFAYVNMEDDGAHGYWNQTADSNHADAELGKLVRDGACWTNSRARICAYK